MPRTREFHFIRTQQAKTSHPHFCTNWQHLVLLIPEQDHMVFRCFDNSQPAIAHQRSTGLIKQEKCYAND
jgi:hypothetical protein